MNETLRSTSHPELPMLNRILIHEVLLNRNEQVKTVGDVKIKEKNEEISFVFEIQFGLLSTKTLKSPEEQYDNLDKIR